MTTAAKLFCSASPGITSFPYVLQKCADWLRPLMFHCCLEWTQNRSQCNVTPEPRDIGRAPWANPKARGRKQVWLQLHLDQWQRPTRYRLPAHALARVSLRVNQWQGGGEKKMSGEQTQKQNNERHQGFRCPSQVCKNLAED